MVWKHVRGTQISRIAHFTAILTVFFAALLWAQQKNAPQRSRAAESPVAVVEGELKRTQGALDSIKSELERGRALFKELQNEEGKYLTRLDQVEKNISVSRRYVELVQNQIDTTEKILVLLGDSLVKAESELRDRKELMKRRMRSAYMTSEASKLQMLLSAQSPMEFFYRVRYVQELNRYDKRLAESIGQSIASVNEKRTAQENHRLSLIKLYDDKKNEQQILAIEESSLRTAREDVRTKKEAFAAMVAELEESQRELDVIIKALETRRIKAREEEERQAAMNFEKRKGKIGWPVVGEVITKFGRVVHPVYKTVIMNNGIDIAAPKGAPVRSVAPGSVTLIDRMRGLGRFVIITHGGGFMTIYAHLDEITVKQNQDVSTGTEIGKVGETGTAGGSKLHFEIRKPPDVYNPEEWLEK